jgi:hypothetical protein
MDFVGVDLHKQVIELCLVRIVRGKRKIIARRQFGCRHTEEIREYFEGLRRFEVVVLARTGFPTRRPACVQARILLDPSATETTWSGTHHAGLPCDAVNSWGMASTVWR